MRSRPAATIPACLLPSRSLSSLARPSKRSSSPMATTEGSKAQKANEKPSRAQDGRVSDKLRVLSADNVCRLEAFGALQQVKLHGLALVERAVAVLLDRGEVHKHIFARGALDKSIPLRPVEPLDCTFLSHG